MEPLGAWAVAIPTGCALRGFLNDRMPAAPFWIVALVATAVLVGGGRVAKFALIDKPMGEFVDAILDDDD